MARSKIAVRAMLALCLALPAVQMIRVSAGQTGMSHEGRPWPAAQTRVDLDPRHGRIADVSAGFASPPLQFENYVMRSGMGATASATGLQVASTLYDYQHNDAVPHQIATNGSGQYVHFAWTHYTYLSHLKEGLTVNFNIYNSATGAFLSDPSAYGGAILSGAGADTIYARGGFASIDADDDGRAIVSFHQRSVAQQQSVGDYSSWVLRQTDPRLAAFLQDSLRGSEGTVGPDDDIIWPHVTVDQIPGASDIIHVVAHTYGTNDNIVYWRYKATDTPEWKGPIVLDSTLSLSYNIAADRTGDKAALITTDERVTAGNPDGLRQVTYRESQDNGTSWIDGTGLGDAREVFITNYNDPNGPGTWFECVGDYDNSGNLHVVWNEKRYATDAASAQAAWKHWDRTSGATSTIHLAYYDNPAIGGGRRLNIGLPSLGFGDGSTTCSGQSNLNYIYMTFVQFGGPTAAQQNDVSARGYMNGDVYLSVSNDGGRLWAPAVNLTHSLSPGCDPDVGDSCQSENWPSIARTVDDTIHIMYIADRDAGDAVFNQGRWTFNPVMYYRIPGGTDAPPICPAIAPSIDAELTDGNGPNCEYHASIYASVSENLIIRNFGNGPLTGAISISPPASWLTVTGAGLYSLAAGAAPLVFPVVMNATWPEGLRQSAIVVTHNDTTKPSPITLPVDFFVFNRFFCTEEVTLHTDWLWLQVSSTTRLANGNSQRGLYRSSLSGSPDSGNSSIYDASLIIAKPPSPDTIVFRDIYGAGRGQPGFRSLWSLRADTGAYGTHAWYARARAQLTTIDSTIGIYAEYLCPQNPDSGEFVLINYDVSNRTQTNIPGLTIGEAVEFDVLPSSQYTSMQWGTQNRAGFNTDYNLIYQQGADSGNTQLAARFFGGMTAIQSTTAPRAWNATNDPWLILRPGGGFHEGYLYQQLAKSGFEIVPPPYGGWPGGDRHSVIAFEKNVTLTPSTVKRYSLGLVSSTQGPDSTDLINTVKKAWRYAFGWRGDYSYLIVFPCSSATFRYGAVGSHEAGLESGCCGCVVTQLSGSDLITITPDPDPCTGTISFAGSATPGPYTATLRLQTPTCTGQPQYTDDMTITVDVAWVECYCENLYELNGDFSTDVFDVIAVIARAFGGADPVYAGWCPNEQGDGDNNQVVDVFDVIRIIEYVFSNGPGPVDPCEPLHHCLTA